MGKGLVVSIILLVVILVFSFWYFYPSASVGTGGENSSNSAGGKSSNIANCIKAGQLVFDESTGETKGECCNGLKEIGDVFYDDEKTCEEIFMIVGYGSICSDCGNRNCEEWENRCNCPKDCYSPLPNVNLSDCAKEGEQFSKVYTEEYPEVCCEGLIEWRAGFDTRLAIGDKCYETGMLSGWPVGVCINCGNSICERIEDTCNCEEDCAGGKNPAFTVEEYCDDWNASSMKEACDEGYAVSYETGEKLLICNLCEKTECTKEGGIMDFNWAIPLPCCAGLKSIRCDSPGSDGKCRFGCSEISYCTKCGDNKCNAPENKCNCPQDCGGDVCGDGVCGERETTFELWLTCSSEDTTYCDYVHCDEDCN